MLNLLTVPVAKLLNMQHTTFIPESNNIDSAVSALQKDVVTTEQQPQGDINGPEDAKRIDEATGIPISFVAAFTSWMTIRQIPAKFWKVKQLPGDPK